MRLTRAQLAIHLICGHSDPMMPDRSLHACMRAGRSMLAQLTKVDYGYDLQKWHDHLKETRQGGYTWNRSIKLPKIMRAALAAEEWRAAAAELSQED